MKIWIVLGILWYSKPTKILVFNLFNPLVECMDEQVLIYGGLEEKKSIWFKKLGYKILLTC